MDDMLTSLKVYLCGMGVVLATLSLAHSAQAETNSDLFERQKSGLFVVQSIDKDSGNKVSVGTGFLIEGEGILASNYHVISNHVLHPDEFSLQYVDAEAVLDVDVINDLALLKIVETIKETDQKDEILEDAIETGRQLTANEIDLLSQQAPVSPKSGDNTKRAETERGEITLGELLAELPELKKTFANANNTPWVFELANEVPRQGDDVVAMGNPYDIGLSLVSGIYNGLTKKGYNKHIHFTGALNPGMSGGPAVNADGKVIGINVAGAGNSVSFLVPVENLDALLASYKQQLGGELDLAEKINADLVNNQARLIDDLLADNWELHEFGPLMVPMEVRDYVNCSASSSGGIDNLRYDFHSSSCGIYDRIFLSSRLDTGTVEIDFGWYNSEELELFQFYQILKNIVFSPFNLAGSEDITQFNCHQDINSFPQLEPVAFKSTYCVRTYLNYEGLYDVVFYAKSLMGRSEGVYLHYTLAGVSKDKAAAFNQRFVESVQWK